MRRMNYPRFDKPTYVGTYNVESSNFVMNGIPEPGFYVVIIKDAEALQQYSCMFVIDTDLNTSCSWYSTGVSAQVYIDYSIDYENIISVTASGLQSDPVTAGSTIELYKLN